MIQEPCWSQRFHHQQLPLHYCADPTLAEQPLFDRARDGERWPSSGRPRRDCGAGKLIANLPNSPAVSEQLPAGDGRSGSCPAAAWSRRGREMSISARPGRFITRWAKPQSRFIFSSAACCGVRFQPLA